MNEQKNNEILLKAMMEKDELSAIKKYCEERSKFDDQLEKALKDPDKTYEDCWDYIMARAKKHLNSKSGHVMPNIIFGWAVHYFTEPGDVIDDEVGKIKSDNASKDINNLVKKSPKPKKTTKLVENKQTKPVENKPAFERVSIFDFMENENLDDLGDNENIEEEDDD